MSVQVAGPAGADSLRAVLDSVFSQPQYAWSEHPNPLAFLARWWDRLIAWIAALESRNPSVYWLLVGLMLAVVVAVVVHAGWVMARTLRAARAPADPTETTGYLVRDAGWHRAEVARLAGAGRFVEAMQADFLRLALELEERRRLRFHPSKTPEEYAREAELPAPERQRFQALIGTLYRHAFAGAPCDAAAFADWQRHTRVDQYAPAH